MRQILTTRNIALGALLLTTLFTLVIVIPSVQTAKNMYKASQQNPYLPYVSYDELPYQPPETRALEASAGWTLFNKGMKDYVRKDYAAAVQKLNLATQSESHPDWWLYLGVSHFMMRNSKAAISALQTSDSLSSPALRNTVRWYLAQAYLLDQKPVQAKALLAGISASKADRSSSADSLLARMSTVSLPAK